MRYIAHIMQAAEGCDYTIACGEKVINIEAGSMEETIENAKSIIRENYSSDEHRLGFVQIYEITKSSILDLRTLYTEIDDGEEELKKQDQEAYEREQLRMLKEKYGN